MKPPEKKRATKRPPPLAPKVDMGIIDSLYFAYPRRVGKEAARLAIARAIGRLIGRNQADPVAFLLGRVKAFAESEAGQRGVYTPHPTTWFNQGRYDDDDGEWNPATPAPRPSFPDEGQLAKQKLADSLKQWRKKA